MQILIQTPRLYLRQFTIADAAIIRQLNNEPGVLQYIPEPAPASDEEALHILVTILLPQYQYKLGRLAVHLKENDAFIGWCGLKLLQNNSIDLGYRFKPSAWGKGYATEAAAATLAYGHNTLQLDSIEAHAHINNSASQKVLEKIGMQCIGEGIDEGVPVKGYVSLSNNR